MDEKELIDSINIVLEKDFDSSVGGFTNYSLKTIKDEYHLSYPFSDTLIDIYSNIQNGSELRERFIDLLFEVVHEDKDHNHLFLDRNNNDNFIKGLSKSGICFFTLIKLGFTEKALIALENRDKSSDSINEILSAVLDDSDSFFTISELSKIKDFVIRTKKDYSEVNSNAYLEKFHKKEKNLKSKIINISYNYLKKEIKGVNVEINQDRKSLSEKINFLGFDDKYNLLLNEIDKYIHMETSDVQNAGMINNLRVFMNDIVLDIAEKIAEKNGEEIPKSDDKKIGKIGNARIYLKNKLKLSDNDHTFINAFINILHGEGGHSFLSNKEYFRLARNIAIEISLLIISKYEKLK